jgi:hypothetical protein
MDQVNRTSFNFYTPMWEAVPEKPRKGETVDRLYKRLRRLAKNYQRWGRYFRVRRAGDVVLWQQVPQGHHTRLGQWHNLKQGEEFRILMIDPELELKRARATARYLRRAGKGRFHVDLEGDSLLIARVEVRDRSPAAA